MTKIIGIYVDKGASVETIVRAITQEVKTSYIVRAVVAEHLDDDSFFDGLSVFVMPGGADLPYCAKLNGKRNARLRRWVEGEGVYFGLCAGAYYGCSKLEFHGQDGGISGSRELGFLQGTAVGPMLELAPLYDFTLKSAAIAPLIMSNGDSTGAFYHGGPFFEFERSDKTEVLARYTTVKDEPTAIVVSGVGHGKALLCGVHPEVSFNELAIKIKTLDSPILRARYNSLLSDLKVVEQKRRMLWRSLLTRCGLMLRSSE